jgi:hypothetical protein
MRVLTLAMVALALVVSTAAQAQIYVAEPAPVVVAPPAPVVVAPPAPVVVAPPAPVVVAPSYLASEYAYVPAPGATVVNPRTGRTCTIEPSGYRWCWTP